MEISNEIKCKVLALYLGQMINENNSTLYDTMVSVDLFNESICTSNHITYKLDEVKLVLKPLSEISDEDAIQVDELISPQYSSIKHFHTVTRGKVWIRDILSGNQVSNVFNVYQFLQYKGYDLPNYLLGGKTLQESGLAIYEK